MNGKPMKHKLGGRESSSPGAQGEGGRGEADMWIQSEDRNK